MIIRIGAPILNEEFTRRPGEIAGGGKDISPILFSSVENDHAADSLVELRAA